VTVLPFLLIAAVAGTASLVVRANRPWSTAVALIGLAAMAVTASQIGSTATVRIGATVLAGSDWLRLFAVLGSVVGLGLVIVDLATIHEPDVPGVIVLGLGAAVLALALQDSGASVAAATAGALAGILVAAPVGATARAAFVGARELRAVAVAGALAIGATAWIARPLGDLSLVPEVFGLAYLAFAAAVAIRLGAIPFHLWAARVADAAPGVALPLLMAWGPAAFAAVALVWIDQSVAPLALPIDAERSLVATVGALSVALGILAAAIQDDLEHVVGYTIAADAGFVVLAVAGFDPGVWEPSRIWLLVFVVVRSAFAAWAVAIHGAFGTRRLAELAGWTRRAPGLAVALVAIGAVSVGWPGLGAWDARAAIADLALPAGIATLVTIAPVATLVVYGRLLLIGVGTPGTAVRTGRSERPGWPGPWPRRPLESAGGIERLVEHLSHAIAATLDVLWTLPAAVRLNRTAIASVVILVLAGLGASVAGDGLGVPEAARAVPVIGEPGPGPETSAPPSVPGQSVAPGAASTGPGATPGLSFEPVGGESGAPDPSGPGD
jgi:formate hydrogenlyase subunit 3/multisubunit Na+/H+ antiporter MnhD subunit